MLSTEEATSIMESSGIEVIKIDDEDFPGVYKAYIGCEIVWDKLIMGMKEIPRIKEVIDSIPHFKWIQAILNKYNPCLQVVEVKGKKGYGIKLDPIYENPGKYDRLDRCFGCLFYLVSVYITPLFEPFEANDRKYRK